MVRVLVVNMEIKEKTKIIMLQIAMHVRLDSTPVPKESTWAHMSIMIIFEVPVDVYDVYDALRWTNEAVK
jgi:hypothetical protein